MPTLTTKTYTSIRNAIQKELVGARAKVEQSVRREMLVAYWNVGKILTDQLGLDSRRCRENAVIIKRLAKDLGCKSESFFYKVAKFYHYYPEVPDTTLCWSHYLELVSISDDAERKKLEEQVIRESLGTMAVRYMIRTQRASAKMQALRATGGDLPVLAFERGSLYTYSLHIEKKKGYPTGNGFLDLGFGLQHKVRVRKTLKNNVYYAVISKGEKGYQLRMNANKSDLRYTYGATIKRIIDGDTLVARIDLGFSMWIETTLRLRGIDSPERYSARGRLASEYVKKQLFGISCIVVRTYKSGKFGRYISDIFYTKGESDPYSIAKTGTFLNQELLDTRHAVAYRD